MKTLVKQSFSDRVISLIEAARAKTVVAVNLAMVYTYYEVGRMIIEEEQGGKKRAGYGEKLLIDLARKLTAKFGKGSKRGTDPIEYDRLNMLLDCKSGWLFGERESNLIRCRRRRWIPSRRRGLL